LLSPLPMHPSAPHRPNRQQIVQFLRWATRQPDTWVLSFAQALAYYKAPAGTPVSAAGVHCQPGSRACTSACAVPTGGEWVQEPGACGVQKALQQLEVLILLSGSHPPCRLLRC